MLIPHLRLLPKPSTLLGNALLAMPFTPTPAIAQTISTFAGFGGYGTQIDPHSATSTSIWPVALCRDHNGNTFVVSDGKVLEIAASGAVSVRAGTAYSGFSGDGGPASAAQLNDPRGIAVTEDGTIFISDLGNNRVRRIDTNGVISTIAGDGDTGPVTDGVAATSTSLYHPTSLLVGPDGSLYVIDAGHGRVRRIDAQGKITTVAGDGQYRPDYDGDNVVATSATIFPFDIAMDADGVLYISEGDRERIRKVGTDGILRTIAGTGVEGFSGDGGQALAARFNSPTGLALDPTGALLVSDNGNRRIRKIATTGVVSTIAGNGDANFHGDGHPATLGRHRDVAVGVGLERRHLFGDSGRIRKIALSDTAPFHGNFIETFAGIGSRTFNGDGGKAIFAGLMPTYMAFDHAGNLYFTDSDSHRVRRISTSGVISTVAGNGGVDTTGDGGSAVAASLASPRQVAVDPDGNLYILTDDRVRRVSTSGVITTYIGANGHGFSGDGGPVANAKFGSLSGIAARRFRKPVRCRRRQCADPRGIECRHRQHDRRRRHEPGRWRIRAGRLHRPHVAHGGRIGRDRLFRRSHRPDQAGEHGGHGFDHRRSRRQRAGQWRARHVGPYQHPDGHPGRRVGERLLHERVQRPKDLRERQYRQFRGHILAGLPGDDDLAQSAGLASMGLAIDSHGNVYISDYANGRIRRVRVNSTVATGLPGRPTAVTGVGGDTMATVSFQPPASDGGSPIIGYIVRSITGNGWDSDAGSTKLSHVVTNLYNGTATTFLVRAVNANGPGPESAPSSLVEIRLPTGLSVQNSSWTESDKQIQTYVTLDRPLGNDVSFDVATKDGTAVAGSDYVATRINHVVIPAGQNSATIVIPLISDSVHEETEEFSLVISNVVGAPVYHDTASITIWDDDVAETAPITAIDSYATASGQAWRCRLRRGCWQTTGTLPVAR